MKKMNVRYLILALVFLLVSGLVSAAQASPDNNMFCNIYVSDGECFSVEMFNTREEYDTCLAFDGVVVPNPDDGVEELSFKSEWTLEMDPRCDYSSQVPEFGMVGGLMGLFGSFGAYWKIKHGVRRK